MIFRIKKGLFRYIHNSAQIELSTDIIYSCSTKETFLQDFVKNQKAYRYIKYIYILYQIYIQRRASSKIQEDEDR